MPVPSELKRGWGVVVLGASLLLGANGCAKKSNATHAPANEADAGYAQPPGGDELAQLEAYEAQLRELGVKVERRGKDKGKAKQDVGGEGASVDAAEARAEDGDFAPPAEEEASEAAPAPAPAAASGGMDAPMAELAEDDEGESRCVSLCSLSEAICSLEARICEMSEDHPDDDTYIDACERAIDDCAVSGDACNTCDP